MLYLLLQKKKCKNCGKLNHRDVLFCWLCGCSFNHLICVSGHKNPAWVQYCRTCGKDRSLMSRPHSSKELSFSLHPTKPRTYIPSQNKTAHTLAWLAIVVGTLILSCLAFLLTSYLW
jgi:hypothetical protein